MTHRWRLLFHPIIAEPAKVTLLVQAICVLHNYLRTVNDETYAPPGYADTITNNGEVVEGFWRAQRAAQPAQGLSSTVRNSSDRAMGIRDYFSNYFMSPQGSVSWQLDHINQR